MPGLPGGFVGVDVFFVISGFLITGLILREVAATGRLSLTTFYARRAKRLLPATVLVLVSTAVLTWLFLPITQRDVFGGDIAAASVYVVNWVLAGRSVDYLAEGIVASPVQHFWSLAVEEQFYIIWPLVILVIIGVARRNQVSMRLALGIGLAAVAIPSFAWSVHLTGVAPDKAYFVTTTRLWELGIGAALALALPLAERLSRRTSMGAGALGLALILSAAIYIDGSAPWPGWYATIPVVGSALVILAGSNGVATPISQFLSTRPMVWVGGISYSLYLWHWPLVVTAGAHFGGLSLTQGLLVSAGSVLPAWLSHRYIENPVRRSTVLARSTSKSLALGAGCMTLGLVAGLVLIGPPATPPREGALTPIGDSALTIRGGTTPWDTAREVPPFSPQPEEATKDVPAVYDDGCQVDDTSSTSCTYGDLDATETVVLVGDSMATQWQPALDKIGSRHGFRVVTYLKSSCAFAEGMTLRRGEPFEACAAWNDRVMNEILALAPRAVVTTNVVDKALEDPTDPSSATPQALASALASTWQELRDNGSEVIVITKNPEPPEEIYECVARHLADIAACTFPANETTATVQREAAGRVPGVKVISMTDRICPGNECPAVIGGALIYRQGAHLTKTWVDSSTPVFENRLIEALSHRSGG